ncbi:MAG: hydantoinase/oxoprolinase family protein [Pseudomonadota bacterium]|nr:hydantoinase/oxoprolinase family protein [Pseudomonadota bacterium]
MTSDGQLKAVGIDVGGTFTDLILLDPVAGDIRVAKVPTTTDNQALGVLAALAETAVPLAEVQSIIHGTTTTTNALLERKVSATGLITTRGFRDVLELGRRTRPQPYGLKGWFEPLIPRERRLEVNERMDAAGEVVTALDEDQVRQAARRLLDMGCESLVIHFLHAYVNSDHERRAGAIAAEVWPNQYITLGHAILSEYREYERGVTAAVNGCIRPVLDRYIARLRDGLAERGYGHDLLVMQGNGGTVSSTIVAEAAVKTVMSGPASGVMAAAYTATAVGIDHVITYDMGGTSCDVGVIRHGVAQVSGELELEYAMPIHVPMVDVHSIGAGGGSIASINAAGILQVGPESAGADPGPICYGRGGARPTITDANLLLGRLNPAALLSVDDPVSLDRLRAVFRDGIGAALGLDGEGAAAAVLRIANDRMAGALRLVSLERGHDPRDFALFAFGGAGPLHASALSKELGVPSVMVPARPGITNALGCLAADVRHDYVNTVNLPVSDLDMARIKTILVDHIAEGEATIRDEGVAVTGITVIHTADMQFHGQSHILNIAVGGVDVSQAELQSAFETVYWRRFEVELPEIRAVLVNLHTAVIGERAPVPLAALAHANGGDMEPAMTRRVWFESGWAETPIYRREQLPPGATLIGPAIIEQLDTTVVVEPGDNLVADDLGNLIITVDGAGA